MEGRAIAAAPGDCSSRKAIVGYAHRLGWAERGTPRILSLFG
jgi:hypothetical protein